MGRHVFFAIFSLAFFSQSCATYNASGKVFMKRDQFGEAPVVDMRDMASYNQRKVEKKNKR